ncbi:MAG: four helix bundle protein [Hyphomicrobiales bacterium]|nr:MAG: four helix bundle protein [Hyphomicrobiales bacterium]
MRSAINSYRDLLVWQAGVDLAAACYAATMEFPREELYGMVSQIRRASTSIPANIAEGHGRDSSGHYVQFLKVAQGSLKELETHIVVSLRVGLLDNDRTEMLLGRCDEIGRMLRALIRSIERTA